jgi:autotransporter-associated beta strand protein
MSAFKPSTCFLALVLLAALESVASAQSIFSNPINGGDPSQFNPFTTGQVVAANLTASGIGRAPNNQGNNAANVYAAIGWTGASLDTTKYFTWTVTPNAGYEVSFTSFVYNAKTSGNSPPPTANAAFRSSVDGFGTNIGTALAEGNNITISLAGSQYQARTTATEFRLYAWGAGPDGVMAIEDFNFTGTVTQLGTFWDGNGATAGIGGTNTWTSSGTTWATSTAGTSVARQYRDVVGIFAGTAGTVTISGTVTPNAGLQFQTTGYTLTGGTLTLGGANQAANTITTDSGVTATISSVIAGSNGMTKAGAGTLILSGANTYGGGTSVTAGTLQLNSTGSISGTVSVSSGATLSGTGTIGGTATTTLANGAILSPGTTGAGTLTVNALTLNDTTQLKFDLAAPATGANAGTAANPGTGDRVVVNGNLTLDGILSITNAGGFGAGTYTIMTYTGSLTNNGVSFSGPGGFTYQIDTSIANRVNLIVTAVPVPEPITMAALGLATGMAALRRRRLARKGK